MNNKQLATIVSRLDEIRALLDGAKIMPKITFVTPAESRLYFSILSDAISLIAGLKKSRKPRKKGAKE